MTTATESDSEVERTRSAATQRPWMPWLGLIARLTLGIVAVWAGIAKLVDLQTSVRAVRAYQLLPEIFVPAVGHALPVVEIIIGALLITGLLTRYAAIVQGLVMAAFVFGISWAWARGLNIDCGCFGGGGALSADEEAQYLLPLLRDIGLVLGAAYLAWFPKTRFSLDEALDLN
ncbi:MAG TPA: MauE/DoxX family redox-associated membrane protein [Actinomycetales bacterium]|nr:MauE/DoxX family redox-associated membrane protein [Actinomycetales bacterium]